MIKNISFSVLLNALSQIVLFAIFLVSAKLFGPSGRGVFSAVISLVTLIGTLAGLSIGRICAHQILTMSITPKEFYKKYFGTILGLYSLTVLIGYVIIIGLKFFYPAVFGKVDFVYFFIIFISLPYFIWNSYSVYIFSSLNKILLQNKISFSIKLALLLLVVVFYLVKGISFKAFMIIYVIANIVNLLAEQLLIFREIRYKFIIDFKYLKSIVAKSLQIHLDTIGYILYSSLTVVILNMNVPVVDLGYYNFALQLTSIIIIIPTIIGQYLNGMILNSTPDKFWPQQKKIIFYTLLICCVVMFLAYLLLPVLIDVTHLKFKPSIPIFNILLITILPNTFTILMGPQWLSRGYFKTISGITLLCGITGFVFLNLTVKQLGVMSGVYTMMIIYFISAFINIYFYIKISKNKDV